MSDVARDARALRRELDRNLVSEVEFAMYRAMAHARLDQAIVSVVAAVDHPAITVERHEWEHGHTQVIRLLGRVLMRWCFASKFVDLYSSEGHGARVHLRLTYFELHGSWRISMPGRTSFVGTFSDEEAKVLEVLRDATHGLSTWSAAASDIWDA